MDGEATNKTLWLDYIGLAEEFIYVLVTIINNLLSQFL